MKKNILLLVALVTLVFPLSTQAANKLVVRNAADTADAAVVTDSGYIGLGTSAPSSPLHAVTLGAYTKGAIVLQHRAIDAAITPDSYAYNAPNLSFYRNNDPSLNSGFPRSGQTLGYFTFGTIQTNGFGKGAATVKSIAEGNFTDISMPSAITFMTTAVSTTTVVERMRVNSNGNVGIGTGTPTQKLEVNGGIKLNTTTGKPVCAVAVRGTMWFTQGIAGVADTLEVCAKDAANVYAWRQLY